MPGIASRYLQWLRQSNHISQMFLSVEKPTTLWVARVTGGLSVGETDITFNSGTGTGFSAITDYQEVWLGVAEDDYSYGKLRIRSISSGDGGVTGTVTVARHGHHLPDGLWLTFKHNYPLRPVYPYIDGSGDFYKDGDITYTDQNDTPNPVVIAGPNQAGFIYDGAWTIDVDMSDSYPVAPGATIATYGATVYPTTGVTITINPATGLGDIEFTVPGQYWVKYAVVDSNGKNQSSRRWYYAHSTDPTSEHYPYTDFQVSSLEGDYESGGWNCVVTSSTTRTLLEIPDEAICVLWQLATYDDDELTPLDEPYDGRQVVLSGYNNGETWSTDLKTGVNIAGFNIATIDERMRGIYMFSVSLEARPDPSTWYEYLPQLTVGRAIHHLWRWHSTLLQIADVYDLTANEDGRAYAEMDEGSIYGMANDLALQKGIRARVVCGKGGDVHICPDVQLLTDSERAALDICFEIEDTDRSDSIAITRNTARSSSFAKVSGFYYAKTLTGTECPNTPCPDVEPYCSSAPGLLPTSEGGYSVAVLDKQVLRSQSHCDELAGRLQAAQNKEYSEIVVPLHGNYLPFIDICYPDWYIMSLTTSQNARGIAWVNKNLILRNITCSYDGMMGVLHVQLALEAEQEGFDGVPGYCLDEVPEAPGDPPLPPLETEWGIYTAASLNFKDFVQEEWVNLTTEATNDFEIHPWGGGLWRCGDGYIKRSTNGTYWYNVTPSSGPVDPTLVDYVCIDTKGTITGSTVYVLGNISGTSYLLITNNGGSSWTWVGIGEAPGGEGPESSTPSIDYFGERHEFDDEVLYSPVATTVGRGSYSSFAKLSINRFVVVYTETDQPSSFTMGKNVRCAHLYMPDTTTLTVLDDVELKAGVQVGALSVVAAGATTFVAAYSFWNAATPPEYFVYDLAVVPCNISAGTFIVAGTEQMIVEYSGSYGSSVKYFDMAAMPNDELVIAYTIGYTSSPCYAGSPPYWYPLYMCNTFVCAGYVLGGSLVMGTPVDIGETPYISRGLIIQSVKENVFIGAYLRKPFDVTYTQYDITLFCGHTVTNIVTIDDVYNYDLPPDDEPEGTEDVWDFGLAAFESGKFVIGLYLFLGGFSFTTRIKLVPGNLGGFFNSITITEPPSPRYEIGAWFGGNSSHGMIMEAFNTNYGALCFSKEFSDRTAKVGMLFFDEDGTIYTESVAFQGEAGISGLYRPNLLVLDSDRLIVAYQNLVDSPVRSRSIYIHRVNTDSGSVGGGAAFGIGVSSDRYAASRVWVTWTDGASLKLSEYDTSGNFIVAYNLGAATFTQVLNRERYAFPLSSSTEPYTCYVFGKMQSVSGLGPANVTKLNSTEWSLIETSWSEVCGSLFVEPDGTISAIRVATVAKLYRGDSTYGLSLVGSLPIYDVAAKAMKVGFYVGDIYIGSYDAGAIMVIRSIPPYASWADITSNHQNISPINALELKQEYL